MKWFVGRFKYAFSGLYYALKDKSIFLQFLFACPVILAGIYFRLSLVEWLLVILCITLVLVLEILNSCIEHLVDYISLDRNENAKRIKDMAAAAVFLVSFFSLLIGLFVFIPKLL